MSGVAVESLIARPEDKGPGALTPNTVELIPTLIALSPRGGPVQDRVLTAREKGFDSLRVLGDESVRGS